jgi:S1-C subfamily serine protease
MNQSHRRFRVASLILAGTLAGAALPAAAGAQATPAPSARSAPLARPTGWLGIHYSAEAKIDETGEGLRISYNSYPVIEAIEPGSPAERSGLQVGDTLIAFNGHDFVRRGVPMSRLLRPGEKLTIRLHRNRLRTVNVTVGTRPSGAFGFRMTTPATPGARVLVREPRRPGAATDLDRSVIALREASDALAPEAARLAEEVARTTVRALERDVVMNPSVAPLIAFGTPSGSMLIAGAEMVPVKPGLGDVLGVRQGVLLVNVPSGTPAERSGLRDGDVVVRAGTTEVRDPAGLHMAMLHAGPVKTLALDVVRKGRGHRVTLRW